ncbi:hypothetical protein W823_22880 [Williamsia sp. D3]|nr:hypothetical protein W823_22880 [Williamsia sp. D3]
MFSRKYERTDDRATARPMSFSTAAWISSMVIGPGFVKDFRIASRTTPGFSLMSVNVDV